VIVSPQRGEKHDSYMQLAIYDLIGALFAPSDPSHASRPGDRLFARIRGVVKDGFADPDFSPREVAAEAGISLRYLQKLFTARGLTCSEFIYSLRLDHAGHLLHRRATTTFRLHWINVEPISGFMTLWKVLLPSTISNSLPVI
jgi:AraC family transcriptional activator of tynA and feaB